MKIKTDNNNYVTLSIRAPKKWLESMEIYMQDMAAELGRKVTKSDMIRIAMHEFLENREGEKEGGKSRVS